MRSVDAPFHRNRKAGTMVPRTRRKSAPGRRANANAQGPRRPKGHDRLMHILYLLTPNPRGGGR